MDLFGNVGRNLSLREISTYSRPTQTDDRLLNTEDTIQKRTIQRPSQSQIRIVTASDLQERRMAEEEANRNNLASMPSGRSNDDAAVGKDDKGIFDSIGNAVMDGFKWLGDLLEVDKAKNLRDYYSDKANKQNADAEKFLANDMAKYLQKQEALLLARKKYQAEVQSNPRTLLHDNRPLLDLLGINLDEQKQKEATSIKGITALEQYGLVPQGQTARFLAYQKAHEAAKGKNISNSELQKQADQILLDDVNSVIQDVQNNRIDRDRSSNVFDKAQKIIDYNNLLNSDYVETLIKRQQDADAANQKLLEERAKNAPAGYFYPGSPGAYLDAFNTRGGATGLYSLPQQESASPFGEETTVAPTYFRDVAHSFMLGLALTRLANEGGKMSRIGEFQDMSQATSRLMDLYDRLETLSDQIDSYTARYQQLTPAEIEQQNNLLYERRLVRDEIEEIVKSNKPTMLSSWESKEVNVELGGITQPGGKVTPKKKYGFRPANIASRINSFLQKYNLETDLGVTYKLDGLSEALDALNTVQNNREYYKSPALRARAKDLRKQIHDILGGFDSLLNERYEQYKDNAKKEAQNYEELKKQYKISDAFLARLQLAQDMDMSSVSAAAKTIMYALPQQLGTSNPYPIKMAASLALAAANGKAMLARNILGQVLTGIGFGVASVSQGKDEANAEVFDTTKERFRDNLINAGAWEDFINTATPHVQKNALDKPSDDDIMNAYILGQLDGKLGGLEIDAAKAISDAYVGSSRQYDLNMAAVTTDSSFDTILMTLKVGWFENQYRKLMAAANGAMGEAGYLLKGREYAKAILGDKAYGDLRKQAVKFAAKIPHFGTNYVLAKSAKSILSRNIISNFFEAGQEGVQRDLSLERQKGLYSSEYHGNVLKDIWHDLYLGVPLTLEWATNGVIDFGAIKDKETIANMNGGWLGSLFQSGLTQALTQGPSIISNAYEMETVIDRITGEKAKHRDNVERTAAFLKNLSFLKRNQINRILDLYEDGNRAIQETNPDKAVPVEAIQSTRKAYDRMFVLQGNKAIRNAASSIAREGSKDWRYAMGLLIDAQLTLDEDNERLQESVQNSERERNTYKSERVKTQIGDTTGSENTGRIMEDDEEIDNLAKLSAAIKIRDQYKAISNPSGIQSQTARLAQKLIDKFNEGRENKINTQEQVQDQIKDSDLHKKLEDLYREQVLLQMQVDQDLSHFTKLLSSTHNNNFYFAKVFNAYAEAKKNDNDFYNEVQKAYERMLIHRQNVEDFEITDWNRIYKVGSKTFIAEKVQRPDGTTGYVKRQYNPETEEVFGEALTFDKEEFYNAKQIEKYDEEEAKEEWNRREARKSISMRSDAYTTQNSRILKRLNKIKKRLDDRYGRTEDRMVGRGYLENRNEPEEFSFAEAVDRGELDNTVRELEQNLPEGFAVVYDRMEQSYKITGDKTAVENEFKQRQFNQSEFRNADAQYSEYRDQLDDDQKAAADRVLDVPNRNGITKARKISAYVGAGYKFTERTSNGRTTYTAQRINGTKETITKQEYLFAKALIDGSVKAKPAQELSPAQNQTKEELLAYNEKISGELQKNKTTAMDYFFKVGNKIIRRARVHSAFDQQKPDSKQVEIREKQLREAKERSVDEYKQLVKDFERKFNERIARDFAGNDEEIAARSINLDIYLTDDILQDEGAVKLVARIICQPNGGPALHSGSIADVILRKFFEGEQITLDTVIELPNRNNHTVGEYVSEADLLKMLKFLNILKNVKYRDYEFVSTPIVWTGQLADGTLVAGETDLIAIDRNGDIHIIDFKTSKSEFDQDYLETVYTGDRWSVGTQYSRQQTAYANLIQQSISQANGTRVKSLHLLPMVVNRVVDGDVFEKFSSIELRNIIDLEFNNDITRLFNESTLSVLQAEERLQELLDILEDAKNRINAQPSDILSLNSLDLYRQLTDQYEHIKKLVEVGDQLSLLAVVGKIRPYMSVYDSLKESIKDDVERSANKNNPPVIGKQEGAPEVPQNPPAPPTAGSSMPGFTFVEQEPTPELNPAPGLPPFSQGEIVGSQEDKLPPMAPPPPEALPGPPVEQQGPPTLPPPPGEMNPEPQMPPPPPEILPDPRKGRPNKSKKINRPLPEHMQRGYYGAPSYESENWGYHEAPQMPPEENLPPAPDMSNPDLVGQELDDGDRYEGDRQRKREIGTRIGKRSGAVSAANVPMAELIQEQNERIFRFSAQRYRAATGQLKWYNFIQLAFRSSANKDLKRAYDKLAKWSVEPDFLSEAVITVDIPFYESQHSTFGWDKNKKRPTKLFSNTDLAKGYEIRLNIYYKGDKAIGLPLSYAVAQNENTGNWEGEYLYNKIASLVEQIHTDPNLKNKNVRIVVTNASRTNGVLKFNDNENAPVRTLMDAGLIKDDDELLTLLDKQKIGLSDKNQIKSVKKEHGDLLGGIQRVFAAGREVVSGFVVFNWDMVYNEDTDHKNIVPLFLTPKQLTYNEADAQSDVNVIVRILREIAQNPKNRTKKFTIEHDGKQIETPFTYERVLRTLIRFSPETRELANSKFIFDWLRDAENSDYIATTTEDRNYGYKFVEIVDNDGQLRSVNLLDDNHVKFLIDTLKSRYVYVNSKRMLGYSLGEEFSEKNANPFGGLVEFFKEHPEINQVKISDSLIVDRKDVDFKEDSTYKSLSGAAWAIRHGLVGTTVESIENALVSINDVELQVLGDKTAQSEATQEQPVSQPEEPEEIKQSINVQATSEEQQIDNITLEEEQYNIGGEDYEDDPYEEIDDEEYYRSQKTLNGKTLDIKKAKRRIRRMLGRKFPVQFSDKIFAILKDGYAVGFCKDQMIGLSAYAEQGTEWHEIFHKIFEFLVPATTREKIYGRYADRLGTEDRREIAEAIAEDFKDFMQNLPTVTFARLNVIKTFKEIRDWVNAFRNISDRDLARIYIRANLGYYRFVQPEMGVLDRFNELFGGILYSFVKDSDGNDVKMKYFVNRKQLEDALRILSVQLINGNNIDDIGANADRISLELSNIRKLNKMKSETDPEADSKWFINLTGQNVEESKRTIHQKMFNEIFEKWDTSMREEMRTVLHSYGLITKENPAFDEKTIKKESDPSTVSEDIQGHSDEFYTVDRRKDIDSAITFFLSTIPNLRFANRDDLIYETDDNGNIILGEDGKPILRYDTLEDGTKRIHGSVRALEYQSGGKTFRTTTKVYTNSFGMAEFRDFDKVYAEIYREIHDAKDFNDMLQRIHKRAENDPLFQYIEKHIARWEYLSVVRHTESHKPVAMVVRDGKSVKLDQNDYYYTHDEYGTYHVYWAKTDNSIGAVKDRIVKGAYILTNPDRQSLVTRFYLAFKSQRLNLYFTYANERNAEGSKTDVEAGQYDYSIKPTNANRSTAVYPLTWFENLRLGVTGIFEVGEDSKIKKTSTESRMTEEAEFFINFKTALIESQLKGRSLIELEGQKWNLHSEIDLDNVREIFVKHLNNIGIDIDRSVFDYFLEKNFGDDDHRTKELQLLRMLSTEPTEENNEFSYGAFTSMLSTIALDVDKYNDMQLLEVDYKRKTSKKSYRKGKTTYKAVKDTRRNSGMYLYGNNNFVKSLAVAYGQYRMDTDEFMQVGPENTQIFTQAEDHTASYITNELNRAQVNEHDVIVGSNILKDLKSWAYVYSQEDKIGSRIVKYLLNPNRSDLIIGTFLGINNKNRRDGGVKYAKISTREDFLSKLALLSQGHILFPTLSDKSTWFFLKTKNEGEQLLPGFDFIRGISSDEIPVFGEDGSMIQYNERVVDQLIEYALTEDRNIQEEILKAEKKIEGKPNVKHYHTDEQGQRYLFMLGVYDKNGNFIPFNRKKNKDGKPMSPRDCFELAHREFFDKPDDERRAIVREILRRRLEETVQYAIDNDIIVKSGRNLKNNYLDYSKIEALKRVYQNNETYKNSSPETIETLAIYAYLLDTNARMIMSVEETESIYTGHPGFFKHVYDENGVLIDRHGDEVKRLGGLGSTGPNNREDLPNIGRNYTCAEIEDFKKGSTISESLQEAFKDNEYREVAIRIALDEIGHGITKTKQRRQKVKEIYSEKDLNKIIEYVKDHGLSEIVEKKITAEAESYKSGINVADGTAFISDKMAENLLIQRGAYTKRVREAFKYLRGKQDKEGNGLLTSEKAYRIVYNALLSTEKYSAFGYRVEDGLPIHYYNKFALFPIFDTIAYGFTKNLLDKMNEADVDMVMFDSAVKAGSENAQAFNPEMSDEEIANFSFKGKTYELAYAFIRRQLNTEPGERETMAMGTQAMKICLSNIVLDAEYEGEDGVLYGNQIRDQIMDDIVELSNIGRNKILSKIGINGEITLEKLGSYLKEQLLKRNADRQTLTAFDIITKNGKRRFRSPISAMSNSAWIESILASEINKNVIDVNLPGKAYYQRTVFGMDDPTSSIIASNIYNGKKLRMINSEGSMDAVISYDYFMHLVPKDIRYNFEKGREWLIKNKIIGEEATANTMAYRIPTQAQSSIHALRFVDVIPVMRDTIVLPEEFTRITGSDFDIDKLYLSTYNYQVKDGAAFTTFDKETNKEKYHQNRLLSNYLTLLKDGGRLEGDKIVPGRTIQYLHRPIDNDTELVKSVHDRLYKIKNNKEESFSYGSIHTLVDIKKQFINGKFGIGPFALNNNSQILTYLYGVEFAPNYILQQLGLQSLHEAADKDGNSIMSWLSAMINAHVDVAKDPYIADMNVGKFTYNITNMLLRTGMGEQTFAFLMQDSLKQAASAYDNAGDGFIDDVGKSTWRIQREAVHEKMHKLYDNVSTSAKQEMEYIFGEVYSKDIDQAKMDALVKKVINIGKQMFTLSEDGKTFTREFYVEDLVDGKSVPKKISDPDNPMTIFDDMLINPDRKLKYGIRAADGHFVYYTRQQLLMYTVMLKELLDPFAQDMSNLVNYTKIDTKKQGSNYFEQLSYLDKFEDLYEPDDSENPRFNKAVNDMLDKSFIARKTRNAINLYTSILGSNVVGSVNYKTGFGNVVTEMMKGLGLYSEDHRRMCTNLILGAIKGRFFDNYMRTNEKDINDLFYGRNSIANRLVSLKAKMKRDTTGTYNQYIQGGVFINQLLDSLVAAPYEREENDPMFVTIPNNALKDANATNNITDAWEAMLNDNTHPEVKSFAEDLVLYAFYTSSDTSGFTKIFKYVPMLWKDQSGYVDYMIEVADMFEYDAPAGSKKLWIDAALNAWQNPNMIRLSRDKDKKGKRYTASLFAHGKYEYKGESYYKSFPQILAPMKGAYRYVSRNDSGEFPMFYKIKNTYDNDYKHPLIYIKIAEGVNPKLKSEDKTYPIYMLVRPKGAQYNVLGQIFQLYEYDIQSRLQQAFDDVSAGAYMNVEKLQKLSDIVRKFAEYMQNNPDVSILAAETEVFGSTAEADERNGRLLSTIRRGIYQSGESVSSDEEVGLVDAGMWDEMIEQVRKNCGI